jgi:type 1 fimbria pilin
MVLALSPEVQSSQVQSSQVQFVAAFCANSLTQDAALSSKSRPGATGVEIKVTQSFGPQVPDNTPVASGWGADKENRMGTIMDWTEPTCLTQIRSMPTLVVQKQRRTPPF